MKFKEAKETMNPNYRTWVYKKGEKDIVVGIEDAIQMLSSGWSMSPSVKNEIESLKEDEQFNQICDEVAQDRNQLLNLEEIKDPDRIRALLERMFGVKMQHNAKVETLKKRVMEEAEKLKIEGRALTHDHGTTNNQSGLPETRG